MKLIQLCAPHCIVLPPCKCNRNQLLYRVEGRQWSAVRSIGCRQVGVRAADSILKLFHELRSFSCFFGDVVWYKQRNTSNVLLWNGVILLRLCCGNDQGAWRKLCCNVWYQWTHELFQSVHVIVSKNILSTEYRAKELGSVFVKVRDLPVTCHPVVAIWVEAMLTYLVLFGSVKWLLGRIGFGQARYDFILFIYF